MENKKVFLDKSLSKENWIIPDYFDTENFSSTEDISTSPFAVIIPYEKAESLSLDFYLTNRVIIDCAENEISKKELRDLILKKPFYIVIDKDERNLENIFKKKGIPLKPEINQTFFGMVYSSKVMENIVSMIKKVAKTDATVLIRGESGTGKELVAKAIHSLSNRKNKHFIAVNCASIPETLLEAELFGHKKGAFTDAYADRKGKFEEADGGTLFLDEIGDMPLSLQAKILRVLQEKEITPLGSNKNIKVNVRVVSATSRNLEEMVKNGDFREDLYYRLNVIPINLPPLRERKEDIPELAEFFLKKSSQKHNIPEPELTKSAIKVLKEIEWKGNIRELENFVEKVVIFNIGAKKITDKEIKKGKKEF
ncbi:Fis family transcriptional regulator [Thermotomaculum hydrothermale]|uniref:Fis family transcriptional regulator n=1 Tax=Thermotomaculum hydrothermale TaxID=981385 RepID=A0A7R6SYQ1_9BACT|nr:sigma-54 dependent transcriptional regulator [Thermotomaculum hydrothermale]BBB33014.1 Fis family transcriptional regulator [Thermotomaculum hydrothermale]